MPEAVADPPAPRVSAGYVGHRSLAEGFGQARMYLLRAAGAPLPDA